MPTLQDILEALLYLIWKVFLLSQMGISQNFISFPGLLDMIIWSCTCFFLYRLCIQQNLNNYHGLYKKFHRVYYSSFEIYFSYLKWVFHGISFCSMVWEISSIKATYVYKTVHAHLFRFNKYFLLSGPPQRI